MVGKIAAFLALARKVIGGKMTIPVLEQICFLDGWMMVTDLENTLVMKSDIEESFTISHKLLAKIMKQKPQDIKVNVEESKVHLNYDEKELTFISFEVADFPDLPDACEQEIDVWDRNWIAKLHGQRVFVSHDEIKPALCGVYVKSNGSLESCATDGHMLRVVKVEQSADKTYEMILPAKSLDILLNGSRKDVRVFESKTHYRFALSHNLDLYVRKLDLKYPDYNNVIPEKCPESIQFGMKDFLQLIKASKPFVNRQSKLIEIAVEDLNLSATVVDVDEGISWQGHIAVHDNIGGECSFGFQIDYLEKLITAIDTDQLTWAHNGSASASLFSGDEDQINLLMPVRLERNEYEE